MSQPTHTNNKKIGCVMVESVLCYGSEVWTLNADLRRRLNAVEMDYLRRSARISRTNEEVRRVMNAGETVVERIGKRGLKWFGHVLLMPKERLPKKIYQSRPPGNRTKGRPRLAVYTPIFIVNVLFVTRNISDLLDFL